MEQQKKEESLGHTSRGLKWEYMQCWYFLFIFSVWLYWVPFVYTGLRVFDVRWIFWGFVYGIPAFINMAFDPAKYGLDTFVDRAVYVALIFSTIHAVRARAEFLERLVAYQDEREELREITRQKKSMVEAQRRAELGLPASPQPELEPELGPEPEAAEPAAPAAPRRMLFDANTLSADEFARLPHMGPAAARQAVALREQLGGYESFDHFADKMGLNEKTREGLRPLFIQISPPVVDEFRTLTDGSRVLEINLASAAAIAVLPGLNWELARKTVQLRDTGGPFKSTEDFRYRLGLTMEQTVPLYPIISTLRVPVQRASPGVKPSGRIVDV